MEPASSTPTAILLIDIQKAFTHPALRGSERSTPDFETNIAKIIQAARAYNNGRPEPASGPVTHPIYIIHIHHQSTNPDSAFHPSAKLPGTDTFNVESMDCATPLSPEPVITKNVNSAFIGTDLEARLRALNVRQLVFAGLTTDHCVSTTARMAENLRVLGEASIDGDGIFVLQDGTATYAKGGFDAETVHAVNLASLNGEFATVVSTKSAVEALF